MRTSAFAATVLLGLGLASGQQADPLLPNTSWVEQAGSATAGVTRGQSHAVQLDFRVKKG